jgi:parallel beta-helix repeat protein
MKPAFIKPNTTGSRRIGRVLAGTFALLLAGAFQSAQAATLCVSQQVKLGCYATVSLAVSAATAGDTIRVAPGTYTEYVVVNKALSLVGASPNNTIIDATGKYNAIYVDGTSNVVVTGFTLENAQYEGILVNQSSSVTVWGNRVVDNNKNLVPSAGECTDLSDIYPFEVNEGDDCGEGIHLVATDYSSVFDNTVENNAGGILLTDDGGPTHNNSVTGNKVRNNVYDCGITLASHDPNGVFDNTIAGNVVSRNGIYPPGGAGIGLFSPGGPTKNYDNVVVNNDLIENGIAGVALHTHAPGTEILQDDLVIGNHFARNGADTDLGSGAVPDGISLLVSGGVVSGLVFSQNSFIGETADIEVATLPSVTVTITAQLNNFGANTIGVDDLGSGTLNVDATENWWGCPQGPADHSACSTISGSGVTSAPWLTTPLPNVSGQ